ncbi:Swc4p [Nakaseomyces bracarensis]|uniref:Swc4p n=1 Tax=Nakaseomyces bracarensis TaxID=273131 RepID=UPI003871B2C6
MSSSDIFDVLNIKQKSSSPTLGTPTASKANKPQLTGMKRELYNLLGDNAAPVVIQGSNKFKDKLATNVKPSPWTLAEFQANEYVSLKHWVKGSKELIGSEPHDSQFHKYDVHLSIPEFTETEYQSFMTIPAKDPKDENGSEDKTKSTSNENRTKQEDDWNFEEIEYLFKLCKSYDLRWFVIYDRYEYNDTNRTLEELKGKFYEVTKNYFRWKKPDDPMLQTLNYSAQKEAQRKIYLERLLSRSAAEIAEEEALIIESRKFEMAAKKTLIERENLLRLLDSPQSDVSVAHYLTSNGMSQLYNTLLADKTRKRKIDSNNIPENPWMKQQNHFAQQRQQMQQMQQRKQEKETQEAANVVKSGPATTVTATSSSSTVPTSEVSNSSTAVSSPKKTKKQKLEMQTALKRKSESEYAEHLLQNFNKEERKALGVVAHGEKLTPGVFLRSTKVSTFKPALQNKVSSTLQELEIPARPVMPTLEVMQEYDSLVKKIVTLLDIKKQLDKLEAAKQITH